MTLKGNEFRPFFHAALTTPFTKFIIASNSFVSNVCATPCLQFTLCVHVQFTHTDAAKAPVDVSSEMTQNFVPFLFVSEIATMDPTWAFTVSC